ncbi:hypothetical protein BKA65DRAFT_476491 [Rhexocercosporidium sp. MPI-PUGE-AT-0058]|nr:hypothetical protein BKA65DRAFT_476491 [Rhexocercosporidium sp. MPI-PUGE-AT-0058]
MANLKKRLAGTVLLTVLSMFSICLLLRNSRVGTHLQKISLGTTIDNYSSLWSYHEDQSSEEEDVGGGIRLVVFGDSWVDDTIEENQGGKGKSWPEVMCETINCTSHLSFASTQPSSDYPSLPPTGVKTSNRIHAWAIQNTRFLPHENTTYTLPDLSSQIQTYLSLPPPIQPPRETLFVLSFGFWDIYNFARLDYEMAKNVTDRSVDEIFHQLDILYDHFDKNLYPAEVNATTRPRFRVIIPRLFDPTLTPGWISHRPAPLSPRSVAEEQKNAVYLTERWNQMMENTMGSWINRLSDSESTSDPSSDSTSEPVSKEEIIPLHPSEPFQPPNVNIPSPSNEQTRPDIRHTPRTAPSALTTYPNWTLNTTSKTASFNSRLQLAPLSITLLPQKDIFNPNTPKYLLDIILEHALEDAGLVDASGLGTDASPFISVTLPCMQELQEGEDVDVDVDGLIDVNGMLVCKEEGGYLWWDAFRLGGVGNLGLGREVAEVVRMGRGVRLAMEGRRNAI